MYIFMLYGRNSIISLTPNFPMIYGNKLINLKTYSFHVSSLKKG